MTGVLADDLADRLVLRDPSDGRLMMMARREIDQRTVGGPSIMPASLVNGLASRQEFLDLIRYLREIADGGRTLTLTLPGLRPTWSMEIDCRLKGPKAEPIEGKIDNTIHKLADQ